jgi:hypothetical protein
MISPEQRVWTETKLSELVDQEILEFRNPNHCILKKATQVIDARHRSVPLRALEAFYVASRDLAREFSALRHRPGGCTPPRAMRLPRFPGHLPLNL